MAITKRGLQSPWVQLILGSAAAGVQKMEEERQRQQEYARKVALMNQEQAFRSREKSQEQMLADARLKEQRLYNEGRTAEQREYEAGIEAQKSQAKQTQQQTATQQAAKQNITERLAILADKPAEAVAFLKAIQPSYEGTIDFDFAGAIKNFEAASKVATKKEREEQEAAKNSAYLMDLITNPDATVNGRPVEFADIADFVGKNRVGEQAMAVFKEYQSTILGGRQTERSAELDRAKAYSEEPPEYSPGSIFRRSQGGPPQSRPSRQEIQDEALGSFMTPDQLSAIRANVPERQSAQSSAPPRAPVGPVAPPAPVAAAMGTPVSQPAIPSTTGPPPRPGPQTMRDAQRAVDAGKVRSVEEAIQMMIAAGVDVSR